MRTQVSTAIAVAMGLACATSAFAQGGALAPKEQAPRPDVPLQIQIVISRHQGDKRVSSLPYTLSMSNTPGTRANLRLNTEMPVPTTTFTPAADGKQESTVTSYTMRTVGTNIDVSCMPPGNERRFVLNITVSENWVRPAEAADRTAKSPLPVFQNYQSNNIVHVNDGETAQFTAATDRLTGEVIRVEVTAKVLR